jgi:hemolysin III
MKPMFSRSRSAPPSSFFAGISVHRLRSYGRVELAVDAIIYVIGLVAGLIGAVALVMLSTSQPSAVNGAAIAYAVGLVAMFSCSAAYHFAPPGQIRKALRRADHAAIFIMIAGTYTPLTVCLLDGAWFYGILVSVWLGAFLGAAMKLLSPERFEAISIPAYLLLGLLIAIASGPLTETADAITIALIGAGAGLYVIGTVFHLLAALPFQNAIWHGLVVAAAICHYAAIWGVVFEPAISTL